MTQPDRTAFDRVKTLTGLDFLTRLEDSIEQSVEKEKSIVIDW